MAYEKQAWKNGEAGATPLSDTRMNHIENGIASAHELAGVAGPKGAKGDTGAAGKDAVLTAATTTAIGAVKQGKAVAALADDADLATAVAKINELAASLKAAGTLA